MASIFTAVVASLALTSPAPPIVARADWGARPMLPGARRHPITNITIHHTGVRSAPARSLVDKLRGLQAFSQRAERLASGRWKPAWPDIPYHFYISWDGRIGEARDPAYAGDTNTEYDPVGHLLIVVEGEFDQETPTEPQLRSLDTLTLWAAERWRVPAFRIAGHRDFSAQTACPGRALDAYLPQLRNFVRLRRTDRANVPEEPDQPGKPGAVLIR